MADYIQFPTNQGGLAKEFYPWKIRLHANTYNPGIGEIHEIMLCYETGAGLNYIRTLDSGMLSDMEATVTWHGGLGNYLNDFIYPAARAALKEHFKRTPQNVPPLGPTAPYSKFAFNIAIHRYADIVTVPGQDYPDIVTKVYDPNVPDYPSTP